MDATTAAAAICRRDGDADIFGLGVRLGIYMSTAALLMNCWTLKTLKDIKAALSSTLPLAIALTAVLTQQVAAGTVSDFGFLSALWLLAVQYMGFTVLLVPLLGVPEARSWAVFAGSVLCVWNVALQLWFWASGYVTLHQSSCGTTYVFFFTRLDASGWVRILFFVSVIFTAATSGLFYLAFAIMSFCGGIASLTYMVNHDVDELEKIHQAECEEIENYHEDLHDFCVFLRMVAYVVSWLGWCFAVVGGELTMAWNQMVGINTIVGTSQTMALITGIGALVNAVWALAWEANRPEPASGSATRGANRELTC